MPDAYATFAVDFEANLSAVQSGMQQGLQWGAVYGQGMAQQFSSGFSSGLSNLAGGLSILQGIRGQFASTAQGLSEIFGMKAGAEVAYFRRQLTGMTGDAKLAQQTLDGLVKIANTTSYGNMDIFQLATNAMGSGTSAQNVPAELTNILDAAAGIGINDPAAFRRFSRNLFDIRGKEGEASQRDVNELYRQAPQFVFQAAKVLGSNVQGAREQISSMSGSDLYDLIVKIGAANKGRAAGEGMADPFVAAANAADQLATAMAPTGELVNRFMTPLVVQGAKTAETFAKINTLGHGMPGLTLAIGVTVGAYRLYQGTIGRTTLALNALASAATRASLAQGSGGVLGGRVPPVRAEYARYALAAEMGGASMLGKLGVVGGRLLGPSGWALAAYGGMDALTNAMRQQGGITGRFGAAGQAGLHQLTDILHGGGWMSPWKAFEAFRDYKGPEGSAEDKTAKAAEKLSSAADKLDAAADGYGYGKRGKATLSSIEAGYALLGAERLGIA